METTAATAADLAAALNALVGIDTWDGRRVPWKVERVPAGGFLLYVDRSLSRILGPREEPEADADACLGWAMAAAAAAGLYLEVSNGTGSAHACAEAHATDGSDPRENGGLLAAEYHPTSPAIAALDALGRGTRALLASRG